MAATLFCRLSHRLFPSCTISLRRQEESVRFSRARRRYCLLISSSWVRHSCTWRWKACKEKTGRNASSEHTYWDILSKTFFGSCTNIHIEHALKLNIGQTNKVSCLTEMNFLFRHKQGKRQWPLCTCACMWWTAAAAQTSEVSETWHQTVTVSDYYYFAVEQFRFRLFNNQISDIKIVKQGSVSQTTDTFWYLTHLKLFQLLLSDSIKNSRGIRQRCCSFWGF